jgi:hypothetical protein
MNRESNEFLRSLLDPRIAEFVNWGKVISSTKFINIAEEQIDHFRQHGDYTLIKRLLDPFRCHKSFKPMVLWFCDSAGLDFSFKGSEFVLKRATSAREKEGNLSDYMAKYSGTAKDVGGVVSSPPRKPTRQQELARLFNPYGHRGGSPYCQGGAPGLGGRGGRR